MGVIYVRTRAVKWLAMTKFWMLLFGINFAIGVATGIILEFEFGTNWSNYSWFVGDIFGAPLAIEGIVAFFMESTFIAVMFSAGRNSAPDSTLRPRGSPPPAHACRHYGFLSPTHGCSSLWAWSLTRHRCATSWPTSGVWLPLTPLSPSLHTVGRAHGLSPECL